MFNKPKPYTIQDVNEAIAGLKVLEQLQDKTEQTLRLNKAGMTQETVTDFKQRYERYSLAIASRQKLIIYFQERMMQP